MWFTFRVKSAINLQDFSSIWLYTSFSYIHGNNPVFSNICLFKFLDLNNDIIAVIVSKIKLSSFDFKQITLIKRGKPEEKSLSTCGLGSQSSQNSLLETVLGERVNKSSWKSRKTQVFRLSLTNRKELVLIWLNRLTDSVFSLRM